MCRQIPRECFLNVNIREVPRKKHQTGAGLSSLAVGVIAVVVVSDWSLLTCDMSLPVPAGDVVFRWRSINCSKRADSVSLGSSPKPPSSRSSRVLEQGLRRPLSASRTRFAKGSFKLSSRSCTKLKATVRSSSSSSESPLPSSRSVRSPLYVRSLSLTTSWCWFCRPSFSNTSYR